MSQISMGQRSDLPRFDQLFIPTLNALRELGGSASNAEILDHVSEALGVPEPVRSIVRGQGPGTELAYRLAWVRSYLHAFGAITNSDRGVWAIADKGDPLTEADVPSIKRFVESQGRGRRDARAEGEPTKSPALDDRAFWGERLLEIVQSITPDAFERLCQRILREAGFTRVDVTGRSGDGGIDGIGVLRMNLVSFHVLFQCKRWKGSVGSGVVRDFRGAMVGRADKGLVMTTGTFTADARREASRDGAPAIDLVDGEALCGLLKDLKLGLKVQLVEEIEIEEAFFRSI